jgi:hypothetical protein
VNHIIANDHIVTSIALNGVISATPNDRIVTVSGMNLVISMMAAIKILGLIIAIDEVRISSANQLIRPTTPKQLITASTTI